MTRHDRNRSWRPVQAVALVAGLAFLIAAWLGGKPLLGVAMLAIMVAYVALLALGGRSELVRVLRGQHADERYRTFDLRAPAFAGSVVLITVLGLFIRELVRGGDGGPYSALAALGGLSYIAALLWLRFRS